MLPEFARLSWIMVRWSSSTGPARPPLPAWRRPPRCRRPPRHRERGAGRRIGLGLYGVQQKGGAERPPPGARGLGQNCLPWPYPAPMKGRHHPVQRTAVPITSRHATGESPPDKALQLCPHARVLASAPCSTAKAGDGRRYPGSPISARASLHRSSLSYSHVTGKSDGHIHS